VRLEGEVVQMRFPQNFVRRPDASSWRERLEAVL